MEALYKAAGISRQAFHNWAHASGQRQVRTPERMVVEMALDIRKRYLPGSSARSVYFYIRDKHQGYNLMLLGWGKHAFEALCLKNGLRVEHRGFVPKTTIRGGFMFPNKIEGRLICGIDQIWVSDICYLYGTNGTLLGYATSLIDLYSRRLLGLSFSQTMHAAVTSQEVLRQALCERTWDKMPGLTFHSDGGKQYIETTFVAQLRRKGIDSSMAESCYQNAFAEAFNDILKNHMLYDLNLNSFAQLKKQEQFVKKCYNHNRAHSSLNRLTPVEFEQLIITLQPCQRTSLQIKAVDQNLNPENKFYLSHGV